MIFKVYPFSPNANEDILARDPKFLENFILSEKNINKIRPSSNLMMLLSGMLAFENESRFTLPKVIESLWFDEMDRLLRVDQTTLERTNKQLFQKLGYIVNLTKVKLNMSELRGKLEGE